ncbi:MAG: hypothetical protein AAGA35_00655 [Patescibacteria group bacterium]
MINKKFLAGEYLVKRKSVSVIANELGCSQNKINYWLHKHSIPKRTISEAIYLKSNPCGDPFKFKKPHTTEDWFLYGLGIGLFWGEGNKVNKNAVRLGNTDPALIKVFLEFLEHFFQIDTVRLRFGLQIFSDTNPEQAKKFWIQLLKIREDQFQKTVVTPSTKQGTYSTKNEHGVLTIYFSNTKLRDNIVGAINALQTISYANVAQSVERIHGKSQ